MAVTLPTTRPGPRDRARGPRPRKDVVNPELALHKPLAPRDAMLYKVRPRPVRPVRLPAAIQQSQLRPSSAPAPESRINMILDGRIVIQSILGVGAYGVVYKALDNKSGQIYAVKALSKFNANGAPLDQRQHDFQRREIQLHTRASAHPNIVTLRKIIDKPDCTYVILDYCAEGDLFANITERGRYVGNQDLIRRVALQILDAVAFCHSQGIYHRDLKPENILVAKNAEEVKLADFGLATEDHMSTDFGCGSTFYMSPECQDQTARGYACAPNDVWSVGIILVNLTCGRNPWKQASKHDSTFREYLKDRHFLKTILPLSDEFDHILSLIFELDPARRISLYELRWRILHCKTFVDARPYTERRAAPTFMPPTFVQPRMLATPPPSPKYVWDAVDTRPVVGQSPAPSSSSLSSIDTMMSDRSDNSVGSLPEQCAPFPPQDFKYSVPPAQLLTDMKAGYPVYNYPVPPYDTPFYLDCLIPQWGASEAADTFYQYAPILPQHAGY